MQLLFIRANFRKPQTDLKTIQKLRSVIFTKDHFLEFLQGFIFLSNIKLFNTILTAICPCNLKLYIPFFQLYIHLKILTFVGFFYVMWH